jgi:hypothetical protein
MQHLKLKTGEEIFAKVSPCFEEHENFTTNK